MARANNGGWDFIKEGNSYQYKEDGWIAMVKVIKDNSDSECYRFDLEVEEATQDYGLRTFDVMHNKDVDGYYSGMLQFYERPEYKCFYTYKKVVNN